MVVIVSMVNTNVCGALIQGSNPVTTQKSILMFGILSKFLYLCNVRFKTYLVKSEIQEIEFSVLQKAIMPERIGSGLQHQGH